MHPTRFATHPIGPGRPAPRPTGRRPGPAGFTLVEILIVVVIVGILAALVIPQFASALGDTQRSAFAADVRTYANAAYLFQQQTGAFPEDASSGAVPAGFEDYIDATRWTAGTPLGGVWDFEFNSFSITSGFGVHFDGTGETRDDTFMTGIDAMIDDGNLAAGGFRKIAGDRYYFILLP